LRATFRLVTPLVIGGADQKLAEVRLQSIKGALRFWYRAVYGAARETEEQTFGSDRIGQSMFLLDIENVSVKEPIPWSRSKYDCKPFKEEVGTGARNGIAYLAYSLEFGHKDKQRWFIPPGGHFTLIAVFRPVAPDQEGRLREHQRRLMAALWLLGHIGGLGSRARRGFGTVALESWEGSGYGWEDLEDLPLASAASSFEEWGEALRHGLDTIATWSGWRSRLGNHGTPGHAVINSRSRFILLALKPEDKIMRAQPWEIALNRAGRYLQDYRAYRQPDHDMVKAHLVARGGKVVRGSSQSAFLSQSPERVAFGLPLAFRYSSIESIESNHTPHKGKPKMATCQVLPLSGDKRRNRLASRLWIRIVKIGDRCYPLFAFLDGPFPEQFAVTDEVKGYKSNFKLLPRPGNDLLFEFADSLEASALSEVRFQ